MNEHTEQHPPMKISLWSSKKAQVATSKFIFLRAKNTLKSSHPQKKYFSRFRKKKFEKFKIHDGLF